MLLDIDGRQWISTNINEFPKAMDNPGTSMDARRYRWPEDIEVGPPWDHVGITLKGVL